MGFTLKSKKLLGRFVGSNKNKKKQPHQDDDSQLFDNSAKLMMSDLTKNADGNLLHVNGMLHGSGDHQSSTTKQRSSYNIGFSSSKRLLSSFTMSRKASAAIPHHQRRRQNRRASIETAKISSVDFQSSRLYHNDSDMEEYSHSSYSAADCGGGGGSSFSLQPQHHPQQSQGQLQTQQNNATSQRLSIYSSPPPVRIVEGNSSEEFSSGSIRKRQSSISVSQLQLQNLDGPIQNLPDAMADVNTSSDEVGSSGHFGSGHFAVGDNDHNNADETERRSNVSFDIPIIHDKVVMEPLNDDVIGEDADDEYDLDDMEPRSSRLTRQLSDRPKRASGSSEVSNLSDDYGEDDEEYDQMGALYNNHNTTAHNSVDFHLEFVPFDLRADYLLVYEFLQEEALLANIQDNQWRTQVRSARLRANTRHYLSQINESNNDNTNNNR